MSLGLNQSIDVRHWGPIITICVSEVYCLFFNIVLLPIQHQYLNLICNWRKQDNLLWNLHSKKCCQNAVCTISTNEFKLQSPVRAGGYRVDILRGQMESLGRDLMRERTRSCIQDGGPQKRSANTVPFLPFNTDFSTRNWYPVKFMFRVNTCDIKFNRICPLLLLSSVWNLTQDARTNLIWCANVHCIKTTDARTHIKMR